MTMCQGVLWGTKDIRLYVPLTLHFSASVQRYNNFLTWPNISHVNLSVVNNLFHRFWAPYSGFLTKGLWWMCKMGLSYCHGYYLAMSYIIRIFRVDGWE